MIPRRSLGKAFPSLVCHGVVIRRCLRCYVKIKNKNKTMIRVVNQLVNDAKRRTRLLPPLSMFIRTRCAGKDRHFD